MRKICLLGASGSIGTQTLDVMQKNPNDFDLVCFSVGERTRKISSIVRRFPNVQAICIKDHKKVSYFSKKYPNIDFYSGNDGLLALFDYEVDMVVNALVGFVGLLPTLQALEMDKIVCLANKEALVVGGELVNKILSSGSGKLYPIDSEHSAIKKCLMVSDKEVDKIVLTASGGAFRNLTREELVNVTPEDALKHPTWKMGNKITIDCATMVNKSFEVIEAHYLFSYPYDKIGIKLHAESMIHSYVVYNDGSLRLDEGKPDMRKPIKLALYEFLTPFETVTAKSLEQFNKYHFRDFDPNRYSIVSYAKTVIEQKGTYGAVFNAANEVAVHAFLDHKIPFLAIEEIISKLMDEHKNTKHPDYALIKEIDAKTRQKANILVNNWRNAQ